MANDLLESLGETSQTRQDKHEDRQFMQVLELITQYDAVKEAQQQWYEKRGIAEKGKSL